MALGRKTGGRKKGVQNKENKALREMILQALDDQKGGGVGYLKDQALMNPNAFLSLLGKVLPTTLVGDKDSPIPIEVIERIIVDPKP